jgi:16S rRNA (cytidine1402-2'-O)-methyltransferase
MSQKSYDNSPTLYLIPTPIGNMDDLTYRTVETLKMVDVLFCEDTRETGKLLKSLNISKKMVANHDHNETSNYEKLEEYLAAGNNVGLVSDRGTPVISDPGFELARYASERGYNVVGLPGANALIPALIMSGINPKPFLFYGFLNSKESKRIKELEDLAQEKATLIFYEAPHRINDTLLDISQVLGNNRKMSISREITKKYEEIYRGTVQELIDQKNEYKGELVLVVEGNNSKKEYEMSIIEHINLYIEDGYSSKDAIKLVSKERNLKKSEVYDEYLKYQGK